MGIQTLTHGLLRLGSVLVLGAALFVAAQGQAADAARHGAPGKQMGIGAQVTPTSDLAVLIFLHENAASR
ncbi:hypothetical protein [Zoogloea sp.]|uniref:hypothetical protein n=1 Tax=Zoogloea sp. TaxID=49181 RepID=UPI0035B37C5F